MRESGILMHITSLPAPYGIGTMGKDAYAFVDFLVRAGQRYWQILPLTPTGYGDSPYQSLGACAGNHYLIDLDRLADEGLLKKEEIQNIPWGSNPARVDFGAMYAHRMNVLRQAFQRFTPDGAYETFVEQNRSWLEDYALFTALKDTLGGKPWLDWPEALRLRKADALAEKRRELSDEIRLQYFVQYEFDRQWKALRSYANAKGVRIIGDVPIYVPLDSADVWANPELFQLDAHNAPTAIAGCPPDAFAEDGQAWGNPLYNWNFHRATDYAWWVSRMWYSFKLYDVVRIDHFRGFDEYFSIPADAKTARGGHWEKGPGMELFNSIRRHLGNVSVIAEDLGLMTDGVRALVRDSGYPNMKVLQFAVDPADVGGANDYWPHNYNSNCVVYTGTHDNETLAGWYAGLSIEAKTQVRNYLSDYYTPDDRMYKVLINLAMTAVAKDCIVPIQDHLGLGNEARMNQPGTVGFNWRWRLTPGQVTDALAQELLAMAKRTARANWDTLPKKTPKDTDADKAEK